MPPAVAPQPGDGEKDPHEARCREEDQEDAKEQRCAQAKYQGVPYAMRDQMERGVHSG